MPTPNDLISYLKKAGKQAILSNPLTAGAAATYLLGPEKIKEAVKDSVTLPQRAFEASEAGRMGYGYDPGPALETAMMMAGTRAPTIKPGEAGIFGGKLAKTADLDKLKKAEEMEADFFANKLKDYLNKGVFNHPYTQGADPEHVFSLLKYHSRVSPPVGRQIFNETGWFRSPDLHWKHHIPDTDTHISSRGLLDAQHPSGAPLWSVLDNAGPLFQAYPQLLDTKVHSNILPRSGGTYYPADKSIGLKPEMTPKAKHSVLLHEIQHGVQDIEGFAPGTNPDWIKHQYYKSRTKSPPSDNDFLTREDVLVNKASDLAYRQSAGEAEARAVQHIFNATHPTNRGTPGYDPNYIGRYLGGPAPVYRTDVSHLLFPKEWLAKQSMTNRTMLKDLMEHQTRRIEKYKPGTLEKNLELLNK